MDKLTGMAVFTRVVETGSFSRAATGLGLTQPTVSKHIAGLERHLNARLLNRTTRKLTVTGIGAAYYDKCKRIHEEIESADSLATLWQSRAEGRLRVGSSVAFGRQIIAPMALEFAQRYPEIRIDLSFDDRYVDLLAQNLDVAIRLGKLADSSLGARRLGDNPWVLVATPRYLKHHAKPQRPDDLRQHNCLVYSSVQGDDVWRFNDTRQRAHQVAISGSLRANNLSTIRAAVLAHMGVAILPRYVVRDDLAQKSVAVLLGHYALASQDIHAVYPSPRYLPTRARVFIEFLREQFTHEHWEFTVPQPAAGAANKGRIRT